VNNAVVADIRAATSHILNDRFGSIVLKKSVLPDFSHIGYRNAFFSRSYAKSEPGNPCSKHRFQSQARTFLPWKPWRTFSTESVDCSRPNSHTAMITREMR
jgi:hypothetical protein